MAFRDKLRDKIFTKPLMLIAVFALAGSDLYAQDSWTYNFSDMMEIPSIMAVESSPAHLYVLSEEDGLAVFRAGSESIQWLYSSEGMERRGSRLQADVRFAYLYGDSRRLTIVEPTSVLGVYSSTTLPEKPVSVQRMGDNIYIAMGAYGLGRLSLQNPDDIDTDPEMLFRDTLEGRQVLALASDLSSRLYVLTDHREILVLDRSDGERGVELNRNVELNRSASQLFLTSDELIGSNENGEIFLIDSNGATQLLADVENPVQKLRIVDDHMIVRTVNGQLWAGETEGRRIRLWKEESDAKNHFTVIDGQLWISEFNQLFPVVRDADTSGRRGLSDGVAPEIKPVSNISIPFPRPVIIPLELLSSHDPGDVDFSYRSQIQNASIRGQSFYWQPTSSQQGRNEFTISASTAGGNVDTTTFFVDVRPFNTPPRFMPLPRITINVDEEFSLEITAVDPDGIDSDLIRYLGLDMPDGASLNEQTGVFRWTPSIRQVGEQEFQVIATDQFGAATSTDIIIRVIETDHEEEADIES